MMFLQLEVHWQHQSKIKQDFKRLQQKRQPFSSFVRIRPRIITVRQFQPTSPRTKILLDCIPTTQLNIYIFKVEKIKIYSLMIELGKCMLVEAKRQQLLYLMNIIRERFFTYVTVAGFQYLVLVFCFEVQTTREQFQLYFEQIFSITLICLKHHLQIRKR